MATTLTPRIRQEINRDRLLRQRRPIPVIVGATDPTIAVSARADADFLIEVLWAANTGSGSHDYTMHIVDTTEGPMASNMIAGAVVMQPHTTVRAVAATGLLLGPGQSLVVLCNPAASINFYGWGYDIEGDVQS
ncbi:hypothetical protein KLEP181_gp17 [Paracoccus phage vB_PmaP_KLEP18-1]|nr:hypothetical protein KLEP181_gp17 [Paracoccus phage vB_PmaP_KLEP18-1]